MNGWPALDRSCGPTRRTWAAPKRWTSCTSTPSWWPPASRLTAAPASPFPAQGLGPFGSEFRPTNPGQLFMSNAHNVGAGTGTVSAYTDSPDGALTPVAGFPFADQQT